MKVRTAQPLSRSDRLAELGLTEDQLRESIFAGELHRRRCTKNHPPSYAGIGAWAETVCRLGEIKKEEGWSRRDPSNLSLVVSPDGAMAIAVATGDYQTGRADGPEPRTKYPKGSTVAEAVEENHVQFELFETGRKKKAQREPSALTWILLVTRDSDEIRSELSLPMKIDEEGFIYAWKERILLESHALQLGQHERLEPTEEINIDVTPIVPPGD